MRAAVSSCPSEDERNDKQTLLDNAFASAWPLRESRKPVDACLTSRDYSFLEQHLLALEQRSGSYALLLGQLIRQKLAESQVILPNDIASDVVTGNSRAVFTIAGGAEESRILVHRSHEFVPGLTLLVPTPLGVTLLGMSAGQSAPLPRGDGTTSEVKLMAVAYQPEHERRSRLTLCHEGVSAHEQE